MNARETMWRRGLVWSAAMKLALLVAAGLAVTTTGLPQPVTGPLVNALLILAVEWAGPASAVLLGMVTPLGAASSGTLPLPMVVLIPFIALGNAVLVGLYAALLRRSRWLALAAAALAKFAFLYGVVTALLLRPLEVAVAGAPQAVAIPAALAEMMRWPQLATALAGGLIAFGALGVAGLWRRP
ncbi:MAG: ECF transporter S component [Chloroflexi bacterium]|nr:ECF transporter S component [Chloroflexota bacterium]